MKNLNLSLLLLVLLSTCCILNCGKKIPKERTCDLVVIDWPKDFDQCITEQEKKDIRSGKKTYTEVWKSALKKSKKCKNILEKYDNSALLGYLRTFPNGVLVSSKKDVVKAAKDAATKGNCCIKKLTIASHGAPGDISTGSGQTSEACKYINGHPGNVADWKKDMEDLKKYLCKRKPGVAGSGSTVYLWGCSVGYCSVGEWKMQELANFFDATMVGPTINKGHTEKPEGFDHTKQKTVAPPIPKNKMTEPDKKCTDEFNKLKAKNEKGNASSDKQVLMGTPVAMGIYPPDPVLLPDFSRNPSLPITDEQFIFSFLNTIDNSISYDMTAVSYKKSAFLVFRYDDDRYELCSTLWGHRRFSRITDEGIDLQFPIKEEGQQILTDYLLQNFDRE